MHIKNLEEVREEEIILPNTAVHGDCLEAMSFIPDKSVDMILCDLPFGQTNNNWDKILPYDSMWAQYNRIIKDDGAIVLFAQGIFAAKLAVSNEKMYRYEWIWEKNKSTDFLNAKYRPLRKHINILVFSKNRNIYYPQKSTGHKPVNSFTKHTSDGTNYGATKTGIKGGGQTDRYPTTILKFDVVNNDSKTKTHCTPKPLPLYEYLIKTYTKEGDVVLDNCAGSPTLIQSTLNTGRRFIAIEKEEIFFESIKNFINQKQIIIKNIK